MSRKGPHKESTKKIVRGAEEHNDRVDLSQRHDASRAAPGDGQIDEFERTFAPSYES